MSELGEYHINSLVNNVNQPFQETPIPSGTLVRYHTAFYNSLGTVVNFNPQNNMVTVLWAVPPKITFPHIPLQVTLPGELKFISIDVKLK
jgi:hypothetical protein